MILIADSQIPTKEGPYGPKTAVEILDRSIAYVEEYGFNASSYGDVGRPGCHIGTLARMADNPVHAWIRGDIREYVSPDLVMALEALDEVARPKLEKIGVDYTLTTPRPITKQPGRIAERYALRLVEEVITGFVDQALLTILALELMQEAKALLAGASLDQASPDQASPVDSQPERVTV